MNEISVHLSMLSLGLSVLTQSQIIAVSNFGVDIFFLDLKELHFVFSAWQLCHRTEELHRETNAAYSQETEQMIQKRSKKKQEEEEEGVNPEGFQNFITRARQEQILFYLVDDLPALKMMGLCL